MVPENQYSIGSFTQVKFYGQGWEKFWSIDYRKFLGPPKPRLVSVDTSATTLNLTYAEPQNTYTTSASDLTYTFYLEYFRVCTRENIHGVSNSTLQNLDNRIYYVNTNVTTLRIRNLVPDNAYLLHVYSVFFGVRSMEPMEIIFKTKRKLFS